MHNTHPLLAEAAAVADYLLGADRRPVYLLSSTQAGERFTCNDGCAAFTGPLLDLALMPMLERAGRWHGRGFAAIVDLDRVVRLPGSPAANVIAVTSHELSHFLEREPPASIEQHDHRVVEEVVTAISAADFSYYAPAVTVPPWHQHDWRFIRAACHLTSRLRHLRKDIANGHVQFAGEQYGLSSPRAYMRTLEAELRDSRCMPIRRSLASQPPEAFKALWNSDTQPTR